MNFELEAYEGELRELRRLKKDAERWQFARDYIYKEGGDLTLVLPDGYDNFGMDVDSAIDAAILAAKESGRG